MATKKTVNKAPAVVRETPEVQEVRSDGEYNKYPVYHGNIRFDDDNIVSADITNGTPVLKYNGEIVEKTITEYAGEVIIKLSNNVGNMVNARASKIYCNVAFPGGGSTTNSVITVTPTTNPMNRKYAFKESCPINTIRVQTDTEIDIYLNKRPANNAFSENVTGTYNKINLYCNFNKQSDSDVSEWGFSAAKVHYNVPFPSADDFFEEE